MTLEVSIVGCVKLLRGERKSGRAIVLAFAALFMGATLAGCSGATTPASVVVGIGDSVTAAANCGCAGFVEPYAHDLPTSAGGPARAVNLGSNGQTAAGLLKLVTTPTPTADGLAEADTLLVTIGTNDLLPLPPKWRDSGCPATCYSPAVDAVGSDISGIQVTGYRAALSPLQWSHLVRARVEHLAQLAAAR